MEWDTGEGKLKGEEQMKYRRKCQGRKCHPRNGQERGKSPKRTSDFTGRVWHLSSSPSGHGTRRGAGGRRQARGRRSRALRGRRPCRDVRPVPHPGGHHRQGYAGTRLGLPCPLHHNLTKPPHNQVTWLKTPFLHPTNPSPPTRLSLPIPFASTHPYLHTQQPPF